MPLHHALLATAGLAAPPPARLAPGRSRRRIPPVRATSGGGEGEDTPSVPPSAELPGGVRWLSAPGPLGRPGGALGAPFARVTEHGNGFVILEGDASNPVDTSELHRHQRSGLQRMGRQAGTDLVLGSALGSLTHTHDLFTPDDVIEVELVPLEEGDRAAEDTLGQEQSTGIVLHAALGSAQRSAGGLVPQAPQPQDGEEAPDSPRSRSPRRTQPVRFTCNICQTRTTRVVNPYAWNHGTVFLECSGCHVKHKVKDNLNLFFEGADEEPASAREEQPSPAPEPDSEPESPRNALLDPTNLSWALERDADWRLPNDKRRPG